MRMVIVRYWLALPLEACWWKTINPPPTQSQGPVENSESSHAPRESAEHARRKLHGFATVESMLRRQHDDSVAMNGSRVSSTHPGGATHVIQKSCRSHVAFAEIVATVPVFPKQGRMQLSGH
jgi:hypothetical protein